MSDLKIGDKVKCKSVVPGTIGTINDRPKEYEAIGIVQEIDGNCIKVKFPTCEQWWHRWQCKNFECENCNSGWADCESCSGSFYNSETDLYCEDCLDGVVKCFDCNGTGIIEI